jgi:hypothetical protein
VWPPRTAHHDRGRPGISGVRCRAGQKSNLCGIVSVRGSATCYPAAARHCIGPAGTNRVARSIHSCSAPAVKVSSSGSVRACRSSSAIVLSLGRAVVRVGSIDSPLWPASLCPAAPPHHGPDARGFAGGVVAMRKKSVHGLWPCRVSGPLEIRLIREQAACFVIASSTRLQTGGDCIGQWSSSHRGDTRTRDESVGAPRK